MARDPRLAASADTANALLQDRAIRHQLFLTRLATHEAEEITDYLAAETIPDLVDQLQRRMARIEERGFDLGPRTTERLHEMIGGLNEVVREGVSEARRRTLDSMVQVGRSEAEWQVGAIRQAVPVNLEMVLPNVQTLRAAITKRPFDGMPISKWFDGLGRQTQRNLERAIRQGIVEGETLDQIVRRVRGTRANAFRDGVMRIATRNAESIVRSAVIHTSNQARQATYEANAGVIKSVSWISTLDARTCTECMSLDGRTFPVEQGRRPPAHARCFPGWTPVLSRSEVKAVSKRWYDGYLIVIRTAGGKEVSCTPNHPILTDRGWVAAERLDVGSNVICDGGREWMSPIDPDGENVPAAIEDVAEAFLGSSEVVAVPVPTTAVDFHGDGVDGEVAVIGANRLLWDRVEAAGPQERAEPQFGMRDVVLAGLVRLRPLAALLERMLSTASRFVRGGNLGLPLLVGHAGPFQRLGLALASDGHAGFDQASPYNGAADTEALGDDVLGQSRAVHACHLCGREVEARAAKALYAVLPEDARHDLMRHAVLGRDAVGASAGTVRRDNLVGGQVSGIPAGHDAGRAQDTAHVGDAVANVSGDHRGRFSGGVPVDDHRREAGPLDLHLLDATTDANAPLFEDGADGVVGSAELPADFFDAHARLVEPDNFVGVEVGAPVLDDADTAQAVVDGGGVDAKLAREISDGNTGPVFLDEIVQIERRDFAGHVYNLETEKGFYAAGGIISHNCRCTTVPVLKSWRELGIPAREMPESTRASMDGQVPESLTYNQWLRRQVNAGRMDLVNEALGEKRARLFAAGGLKVDQFTDRAGRKLTLDQLRARESDVFARLNL